MSFVHDIIKDGDTESLIRKYLKVGIMTPQGYEETKLGTPQGGNLSLLLSNIMLNELDKNLKREDFASQDMLVEIYKREMSLVLCLKNTREGYNDYEIFC